MVVIVFLQGDCHPCDTVKMVILAHLHTHTLGVAGSWQLCVCLV